MTKEELDKKATEYALEWGEKTDGTYACCRDGYLAGAEPREKRIADLEAQIEGKENEFKYFSNSFKKKIAELEAQVEEMKCCGNCIHCKYDENEESYEFCEKHQQVVNIAIVPCSEWKGR